MKRQELCKVARQTWPIIRSSIASYEIQSGGGCDNSRGSSSGNGGGSSGSINFQAWARHRRYIITRGNYPMRHRRR